MVSLRAKSPKKVKQKKPKILVYGRPGAGKTWGALDFPKVYYIDCEGGASLSHYTDKLEASGGAYMGPDDGSNDFATVVEQVQALATQKHGYLTLVIDSFSKIYNDGIHVQHELMKQSGKDMTSTFGAEKKPAIALARKMVHWFDRLDMNVILVCHEKATWSDGKQTGTTFDGWEKLDYELDLIMQIVKQGNSHLAKVGKCRLSEFTSGESFNWSYPEFGRRYGLDTMESESSVSESGTPEQVQRIEQLAEMLKLPEATRIKWYDKSGVDHWREMDTVTLQKCIDRLAKQLQTVST